MTRITQPMHRRTLLAAGAVSIPSIALASSASLVTSSNAGMDFHDLMGQAGKHLKSMRQYLRDLEAPGARDEAAFLANQVTILLAQCVMVSDQVSTPSWSEEKYDGNTERFTKDLQIKMTLAVSESVALCRALLSGEDEEAVDLYGKLRTQRKEGHDEFEEDDD